jgi:hypothetical protein
VKIRVASEVVRLSQEGFGSGAAAVVGIEGAADQPGLDPSQGLAQGGLRIQTGGGSKMKKV